MQTNLSYIAIAISICTFIFTILIDLKSSIQASLKQRYLNKLSDLYLKKMLLACYLRLNDHEMKFRFQFDRDTGFIKLKEAFFIEKLTKIIADLREVQSKRIFFSKRLEKKIELLEIILNVSSCNLKLSSLDEIIYRDNTAYFEVLYLEKLMTEIQIYMNITDDSQIKQIEI
ncbi:MAG: hypothetical protein H6Q35_1415 [Proteobacteria bacterium]|nr:hypothetical protein [Pseudomonadota bacterium]